MKASNYDKLLKYLSTFTKIDFRGKESELGSLVEYDKNKNSIFESDELEDIRFFELDAIIIENPRKAKQRERYAQKLAEIGKQNLEDFKIQYLDTYSKKRDFTEDDIKILFDFDANKLKKAEQLFYIENRDKQFSGSI